MRASNAGAVARPELWVVRPGQVGYADACRAQEALAAARQAEAIPDVLLLLQHHPVYTRGRRSTPDELPMGEDWYRMQGIEVCDADRGGRVTYHGPGQLVGYPIVSLKPYGDDVHGYIRRMERAMIGALADWDVQAQVIEGLTGVWTSGGAPLPAGVKGPQGTLVGEALGDRAQQPARKIGAIGVHVSRGVTTHGLAINVNNDLQPFQWIVPCGIESCAVTSLAREHGAEQDLDAFTTALVARFGSVYERSPREIEIEELRRLAPETTALTASGLASVR